MGELQNDVTFSNSLQPCEECDTNEALEFLLANYNAQGRDIFTWLLNQSKLRFCLRARASHAIVAFACIVPVYLRLPDFEGLVMHYTLLCIKPVLRRTGLVKQFKQWSIAITAKAGYAYRMSTSTTLINMDQKSTITRFLQQPNCLDKKTYKALLTETLGGPVTISKNKQDALPYISQNYGIDWTRTEIREPVQTLALMVSGKPVFAALIVDINENIKQVIGYNGSSKHMGLCWAWLATYLKTVLVFGAWLMPDDVSRAKHLDNYYVYFHNMHNDARQNLAIPLL
jgi:hypothetical protein